MGKKDKLKKKQKGGSSLKKYTRQNKTVILVGINHNNPITHDHFKEIFMFLHKNRNTCFYIEQDHTLSQKAIMKMTNFNDVPSKQVVKQFKEIDKKCILGWDIRPSILGERQNGLYGKNNSGKPHFVTHTFSQIFKHFINKLPNQTKYNKLLNIKDKVGKDWNNVTIHELLKQGNFQLNYIESLMKELREDFKNMADEHILKIIKTSNKNLVFIVGEEHYKNLVSKLR